jgi:tubulin alpha
VSTAVVEPYDYNLAKRALVGDSDCVFTVENEALYDLCPHALEIGLRT